MNKTPKNNVRPSFLLPFSIREIAKPSATANRSRHSLSALRTVARPQQSPLLCALAAVHPFVPIALPPLFLSARVRPAALIPAKAAAMRYMYSDSHTLTVFPLHPSSPHPPDQPAGAARKWFASSSSSSSFRGCAYRHRGWMCARRTVFRGWGFHRVKMPRLAALLSARRKRRSA